MSGHLFRKIVRKGKMILVSKEIKFRKKLSIKDIKFAGWKCGLLIKEFFVSFVNLSNFDSCHFPKY